MLNKLERNSAFGVHNILGRIKVKKQRKKQNKNCLRRTAQQLKYKKKK